MVLGSSFCRAPSPHATLLLALFPKGQDDAGIPSWSISRWAARCDGSALPNRKRFRADEAVRGAVRSAVCSVKCGGQRGNAATVEASRDTEYSDTWVRWVRSAETGPASEQFVAWQMGAIHDGVTIMAATRRARNAFTYMPLAQQPGVQRRSRMTTVEWLALRAGGHVRDRRTGPRKGRGRVMLMSCGNGGFTWSLKSSETARTGSGGICNACSDGRTTVSMQMVEPEGTLAGRERAKFRVDSTLFAIYAIVPFTPRRRRPARSGTCPARRGRLRVDQGQPVADSPTRPNAIPQH
ncbi:hypothetical protein AOQ84DRAFT_362427 [Glonium stellatum]|uniref:Uncharacterized protein n=1 Tax=Glonium stellatum TaxID=574774 RepID=A0A8E2F4H4_9PEZI|nr:hypothetical protein AOQ84DRAFT_362427 [Glonium stellatum]